MRYANRTKRPPRTLTAAEQAKLLKVSGEHREGFRDHVMLSIALGCGLRISEIVGLDVEDVTSNGTTPRRTLQLRVFKRGAGRSDPEAQRVTLPDGTYYKLEKYLRGLPKAATGPLFRSRLGKRISVRSVREAFEKWQKAAGFDHPFAFHHLRHTAISNMQRANKDIRKTQIFARHSRLGITLRYEHASAEEMIQATQKLAS